MKMNDPHVVGLEYRIEHGPGIDWSRAAPLSVREHSFDIRVEKGRVRFDLKEHFATEEEARFFVEAVYVRNWEFEVGLKRGPDAFRLRFDRSDIVDRNPPPGPPPLGFSARSGVPTVRADLAPPTPAEFPEPPRTAIKRSPDVDSMYDRYLRYRGGGEPLPSMACYRLTMLEQMAGSRHNAAATFCISKKVLGRIGKLSTVKGGSSARKAIGSNTVYTEEEERFLKSAIRMLIHRAAEVEQGPDPRRTRITLADICRNPIRALVVVAAISRAVRYAVRSGEDVCLRANEVSFGSVRQ